MKILTLKSILLFSILLITLLSCARKRANSFDTFIFSNCSMGYDYSMNFTNSDTVYYQKRFPLPEENAYFILTEKEGEKLNRWLNKLNLSKYDSAYTERHLEDGDLLVFNLSKQRNKYSVQIYGRKGPKELYDFSIWLRSIDNHNRKATKKVIDYGDLKGCGGFEETPSFIAIPPIE